MPPLIRSELSPLSAGRRAQALAALTAAERTRFESDRHPERFLTGRMLLRELAAELTGQPLESIIVTAPCPDCGLEHGRPRVEGLHVSLSHAGDRTVAVASLGDAVGVDVERRDVSPERLDAIHDLTGGDGLAHWTAVEAVLKADGRGLRVDTRAVTIEGTRATFEGSGYRLLDASDEQHVATVAVALALVSR